MWQRSNNDYATIKYSSAGVPLWTNRYKDRERYDDASRGRGRQQQRDRDGVLTGAEALCDYATIKYSSAGVPLWTNRYNGPGNGDDEVCAMAVDGSNNVIVTGYSIGSGMRLRLCDDQVFERGRAALDQPLQRAWERR